MCAMCHSGARQTLAPAFDYKPGAKLSDYMYPDTSSPGTRQIDVHGKQYQLLMASACFQKSSVLTCGSCHNTHVEERNNMKLFSSRCISCHTTVSHDGVNMPETLRAGLINNCIDCHMPLLPSKAILLQLADQSKSTPDFIRTHRIAIYPEITEQFNKKAKGKGE